MIFLFSLVSHRSAVLLNPQVQVHTVEGLHCSMAHGEISRFIMTSDTHFLVYALLMIIQSFEKSTFSKTKFAQEIVPHLSLQSRHKRQKVIENEC